LLFLGLAATLSTSIAFGYVSQLCEFTCKVFKKLKN
jgi:hypothetical protein